jgi:hypothetical protein
MLELTRQEKWLVLFVLLSLLVGAVVKHYRQTNRERLLGATPAVVDPNARVGNR